MIKTHNMENNELILNQYRNLTLEDLKIEPNYIESIESLKETRKSEEINQEKYYYAGLHSAYEWQDILCCKPNKEIILHEINIVDKFPSIIKFKISTKVIDEWYDIYLFDSLPNCQFQQTELKKLNFDPKIIQEINNSEKLTKIKFGLPLYIMKDSEIKFRAYSIYACIQKMEIKGLVEI